jgi:hypothetical protein
MVALFDLFSNRKEISKDSPPCMAMGMLGTKLRVSLVLSIKSCCYISIFSRI